MDPIQEAQILLERAGLIARGRTARLRPSRLEGQALREAADWLEAR